MCGEIAIPGGLDAGSNNNFSATMLRAVAKVEVVKTLEADSYGFEIASIAIYRHNTKVQLSPDVANMAALPDLGVAGPSVPSHSSLSSVPVSVSAGEDGSISPLYIPESGSVQNIAERTLAATCVVVGGKFNGSEDITYYRMDFNSGIEGHPFGQVLRNHHYVFNIKKVLSDGWPTAQEAATNIANSIVAEVKEWQDFTTFMFYGEQGGYMGISSRDVVLRYREGYTKTVYVNSTVPFSLQLLDSEGDGTGTIIDSGGGQIDGGFCMIDLIPDQIQQDLYRIDITALAENRGTASKKLKFRINHGEWSFDVGVTQETFAKYSDRTIRMLSTAEVYGGFGTISSTRGYTSQFRAILDNKAYFSATGTHTIAGFHYDEVNDNTTYLRATSAANLANMKTTIYAFDIIYLTYSTMPSSEVSQLLVEWAKSSRNRILVVGLETTTTNVNLKSLLNFGSFAQIAASDSESLTKSYISYATDTPENAPFLNGPFGTPNKDYIWSRPDNYAGYIYDYGENITPIVMTYLSGGASVKAAIAVDKEAGIVYFGDSSIFNNSTNGAISNGQDVMLANLWAWMTEQVLWED